MNYNELEQMIKNDYTYDEIIEESKRIDEYIKEQIKCVKKCVKFNSRAKKHSNINTYIKI